MVSKAAEFREMDIEELESRLAQAKTELFNLRFQVVTGRLDNTSRLGQVRHEVARILTVLREREITEAEALEATRHLPPPAAQSVPASSSASAAGSETGRSSDE